MSTLQVPEDPDRCANDTKVAQFKEFIFGHPILRDSAPRVQNAIHEPAGALIVFVFGPTGVGKTTLFGRVRNRIVESASPQMQVDGSYLPVVSLSAMAPSEGKFRWKDLYVKGLEEAKEPLITQKVQYESRVSMPSVPLAVRHTERPNGNVGALLQSWINMTKYRRTAAILLDEAQHIFKGISGSISLLDQLDHIKSLADATQTVYVLAGTYDLLLARNMNAQLGRRSIDVHVSRYHHTDEEELKAFCEALLTFQTHLPLKEEPDLVHHWKFFYAHSGGCIGIVKDLLTGALTEALETEAKVLTFEMLEHHALSLDRCEQIITDIEEGEKLYAADKAAESRLWHRLGLGKLPSKKPSGKLSKSKGAKETDAASRSRKTQVGQRSTTRDPVKGETKHDS